MDTFSIFKLVVGGTSALASLYAIGRIFYVAATTPTNVHRANVVVNYEVVIITPVGHSSSRDFEVYLLNAAKGSGKATSQESSKYLRTKSEHQAV